MNVSATLIVRDEELTLKRCLDSIQGAVDEIVIVDTGSQDSTPEIARNYTDRCFQFDWIDDFSAARQYAFDQARGDWMVWLDADDVVQGAENIRCLAHTAADDVGAIYWPYVAARDEAGNVTCQFWRERLVRNDSTYRWQGKVHEVLVSHIAWEKQHSRDVVVEHQPPDRNENHNRRNLAILEAELADLDDEPPARLLFYLAREYANCGQVEQALKTYQRYMRRSTWGDEGYQALLQMAALSMAKDDDAAALKTLWEALQLCPHWPDAYFALARIYYFLQEWSKVIHWTEMGRAMPRPKTDLFTNPMDYQFNWIIYYTNALYHMGEINEALYWTEQALQICPVDPMHRHNLKVFSGSLKHDAHGAVM